MESPNELATRFRQRAEEFRAEAGQATDPKMREMLLNAAKSCEEMAAWKPRNRREE